jgi:tRNA U54 and U55 pseudouridine synthase Pus10
MEQLTLLFEEFIMKAITMTEKFLDNDFSEEIDYEAFTSNRERLFQVIDQISRQIDWNQVNDEKRNDLNRQIDYVKKLDEKLVVKLQEHQAEVRKDIETTVRQKDNIKGYNLSDVK